MEENNENKKNKLLKIGLISFAGSLPFFLGIFTVFIAALLLLDLIPFEASANNDYSYVQSTYSYCESINVGGVLYSLEDYVAGVVEHEAYKDDDEALKAQAIAARTYALVYTNGCKNPIANSQSAQTFDPNPSDVSKKAANDTAGMVLYYNDNLFLSEYDSFCNEVSACPDYTKNTDGTYTVTYTKQPAGETHQITLSDEGQYERIVKESGHARGMSQLVSYQLAKEGKDYEEILKYFYSDGVEIINLNSLTTGTENDWSGTGYTSTYTNAKNGKTYYNYKQCGFGIEWLCNVGCGLTSTSIVISGENTAITPPYLYENYREPMGYVSLRLYLNNYIPDNYLSKNITVKNMKDELITHMTNGGTAIFFIEKSKGCNVINGVKWTNWQHFFVALDYNVADNTVYISNPGTTNESKNGWISLDEFDCAEVTYLIY